MVFEFGFRARSIFFECLDIGMYVDHVTGSARVIVLSAGKKAFGDALKRIGAPLVNGLGG